MERQDITTARPEGLELGTHANFLAHMADMGIVWNGVEYCRTYLNIEE